MAPGVAAFDARQGVGGAGFEHTMVVTADRAERLTDTPLLWWQDGAHSTATS